MCARDELPHPRGVASRQLKPAASYGLALLVGPYDVSADSAPRSVQSVLPDAATVRLRVGCR